MAGLYEQTLGPNNQDNNMSKIILITGTSSGFGRIAAEALAKAEHIVYASMRATTGRNAPEVSKMEALSKQQRVDLRTVEMDVLSQNPSIKL